MISKADYDALLTLIRDFLTTLTAEKRTRYRRFGQIIMLNERQLKIVNLLEQQPRTPGELARRTWRFRQDHPA